MSVADGPSAEYGWRRFWKWWQRCPDAMAEVEADMARQAMGEGVRRLSFHQAWERARVLAWTDGRGREFALNNDLAPYAVRLLLVVNPKWRGLVEVRQAIADGSDPLKHAPASWRWSMERARERRARARGERPTPTNPMP